MAFDGNRLNVTVDDVIKAEGRRTPDSTVAQRRFRFAFILVVPAGSDPGAAVQQVETYRQQFPDYYAQAASGNASAEDTLNRSLKLSIFPAAGVLTGASATATLAVATAPRTDLAVRIDTPKGNVQAPATVVIPAGARVASFPLTGVKNGVEELLTTPLDSAWETAFARVQVADAAQARLTVVDSAADSLTVRLTDQNDLPYPGARIAATASGGGTVIPGVALTDAQGRARFRWDYGAAVNAQLQLAAEAAPSVALTLHAGGSVPAITAVTNAASYAPGISPGGIATIFGTNLDPAATVTVNGSRAQVFYSSTSQINFYVPPATPLGTVTVAAQLPSGAAPSFDAQSVSAQAGIFGIAQQTGYLEIYATGLGPTRLSGGLTITALTPQVFLGATPVTPMYSGLAPGYPGLYQVNVAIPAGLSGTVGVVVAIGNSVSNTVQVTIP